MATAISYFLLNPIKVLESTFKKVEEGDLETRAEILSKDELGHLAQSFNSMIESIVQANIQLARSAKLSTLGELAGGIAHEINNPLAVIVGTAQRLKTVIARPEFDPKGLIPDIERIDKTAWRISKIIKGLRSLSRDSEKDPLESTNLKKLIEECLTLLNERLQKSGTAIKIDLSDDFMIPCRPSQIFQVLMNLIGNANDAIENLKERWIEIQAINPPNNSEKIWIRVIDSGHGIPPSILEKLMTPFFTTKPSGKGTGLGLSIARKIADTHGGKLFYTEIRGHTCFTLELPLIPVGGTNWGPETKQERV
jgi:signal transduction histidine kinase